MVANNKKFVTLNKPWKELLFSSSGFGPNFFMAILGAYFTGAINPAAQSFNSWTTITAVPLILTTIFPILWIVARCFDGIIDIPLGHLTDKLRTRWGNRKLPIAICFIPMVVSFGLLLISNWWREWANN